ncbi:predicted protein [Streptomyces sp. SPB78]|nr:hypothetical protein [Streptomyces sp. SPB78]EFL00304.1 predicted protein [Streptomyces sp. SPB78]
MTQSLGHDPLHKPKWQNLFVEPALARRPVEAGAPRGGDRGGRGR